MTDELSEKLKEIAITKKAEDMLQRHEPDNNRIQIIIIEGIDSKRIAQEIRGIAEIVYENKILPTITIQPLYKNDGSNELVSTTVGISKKNLLEIQEFLGREQSSTNTRHDQRHSRRPASHTRHLKELAEEDNSVGRLTRMNGRDSDHGIIR